MLSQVGIFALRLLHSSPYRRLPGNHDVRRRMNKSIALWYNNFMKLEGQEGEGMSQKR